MQRPTFFVGHYFRNTVCNAPRENLKPVRQLSNDFPITKLPKSHPATLSVRVIVAGQLHNHSLLLQLSDAILHTSLHADSQAVLPLARNDYLSDRVRLIAHKEEDWSKQECRETDQHNDLIYRFESGRYNYFQCCPDTEASIVVQFDLLRNKIEVVNDHLVSVVRE